MPECTYCHGCFYCICLIEFAVLETLTEVDLYSGRLRDTHRSFWGDTSTTVRAVGWNQDEFLYLYPDKTDEKWFALLHIEQGIIPSRSGDLRPSETGGTYGIASTLGVVVSTPYLTNKSDRCCRRFPAHHGMPMELNELAPIWRQAGEWILYSRYIR